MATEKRLILLDEAKKKFDDILPFTGMTGGYVKEKLDSVPAVDAVEVVRCKDCKHSYAFPPFYVHLYCERTCHAPKVKPDDFCSYGERKNHGC